MLASVCGFTDSSLADFNMVYNNIFKLGKDKVSLPQFLQYSTQPVSLQVDPALLNQLKTIRGIVEAHAAGDKPVYGLNTGLGANLAYRLQSEEIEAFQQQLLRGRCAGTGPALTEALCRGALLARIIGVSRGHSGISLELFHKLIEIYQSGLAPVICSIGSIGAGDLLLNAQLGLALTGEGEFWVNGEKAEASVALKHAGIKPAVLQAKDAMVLANSSVITVAQTAATLGECDKLLLLSQSVAAMAAEAYGVNTSIFSAELQALRPAAGQADSAAFFRKALAGSSSEAAQIQDALSFRVMATLFGTAQTALQQAISEWSIEANSAADSPVVLDDGSMYSTPNFHTPAIAHSLDSLSIALHGMINASAQRTIKLMTPTLSGLEKYLSPVGGASAGLVPMQKTIAALLAESRFYAQPAGLDATVVSDMVEDVAPQSLLCAQMLQKQLVAIRSLIGIEALAAAQALDLRKPEALGAISQILHPAIRSKVAPLEEDRALSMDIESTLQAIEDERVLRELSTV